MKRAGSREVKQHWSEYMRRVAKGETVLVTRRGEPILKMVPVGRGEAGDELEALARRMESKGHTVIRPKRRRAARDKHLSEVLDRIASRGPLMKPGRAEVLLEESREDRF